MNAAESGVVAFLCGTSSKDEKDQLRLTGGLRVRDIERPSGR
jgi:hypothetical protein